MKQKILVTGANGLLGRHVLKALYDSFELHAIVRETPTESLESVIYHKVDLAGDWTITSLPDNMDMVFHFAQSERFRDFPEHALEVFNVHVASTAKLLDYARKAGAKKFVFASTGGIYDTSHGPVNENSPVNSSGVLGNYFATKLCSEILTNNYKSYFDVSMLRIFFMYGKGQKQTMLIPRLVRSIQDGNIIKLTGREGIKINPVHVDDVVNILEKLVDRPGSNIFNVAGPQILSLKEICDIIGSKLGRAPIYENTDNPGNDCISDIDLVSDMVYKPVGKISDKIEELF